MQPPGMTEPSPSGRGWGEGSMGSILPHRTTFSAVSRVLRQFRTALMPGARTRARHLRTLGEQYTPAILNHRSSTAASSVCTPDEALSTTVVRRYPAQRNEDRSLRHRQVVNQNRWGSDGRRTQKGTRVGSASYLHRPGISRQHKCTPIHVHQKTKKERLSRTG